MFKLWTNIKNTKEFQVNPNFIMNYIWRGNTVQRGNCPIMTAMPGDGSLRFHQDNCVKKNLGICLSTPPCEYKRNGIFCLPENKIISRRLPELSLRSDGRELQILFPELLLGGFPCGEKPLHESIGNPQCYLTGFQPWHLSSLVELECVSKTELDYNVTRIQMKVITEGEGYLTCQAWISGSVTPVVSNTVLRETYPRKQRYSIMLQYNCSDDTSTCKDAWDIVDKTAAHLTQKSTERTRYLPAVIMSSPMNPVLLFILHLIGPMNEMTEKFITVNTDCSLLNWSSIATCHKEDPLWPLTTAGKSVISADGRKYRSCLANFTFGAQWGPILSLNISEESTKTKSLKALLLNNVSSKPLETLLTMQSLLSNKSSSKDEILTTSDKVIISVILSEIKTENLNSSAIEAVSGILDTITTFGIKAVELTQMSANTGNKILKNTDRILSGINLNDTAQEKVLSVHPNFATLVYNLQTAGCAYQIRGLALLERQGISKIQKQDIVILTWNDTPELLAKMKLQAAVLLPLQFILSMMGFSYTDTNEKDLTNQLNDLCTSNKTKWSKQDRIAISIFWNDALFVHTKGDKKNLSTIIGVSVNGAVHMDLDYPITLIFKSRTEYANDDRCVFWDLSGESGWSSAGCLPREGGGCACFHTTHFGELLRGAEEGGGVVDGGVLRVVALCGCSLSLAGLLAMAATAAVFPSWRRRAAVRLHLCAALSGLAASTVVRAAPGVALSCTAAGAAGHTFLLASLAWMLAAGLHARRRLAKPLVTLSSQEPMLAKWWLSAIMCWLLPFLVAGASLLASSNSYQQPACLPQGRVLHFGVTLPAHALIVANGIVLALCIHAACTPSPGSSNRANNQRDSSRCRRQLLFSLYLSVLLGVGWIFGLLHMDVAFNVAASLQGFAIFFFAVVLDSKTRTLWKQLLCINKYKRTSETKYRLTLTSSSLTGMTKSWRCSSVF